MQRSVPFDIASATDIYLLTITYYVLSNNFSLGLVLKLN